MKIQMKGTVGAMCLLLLTILLTGCTKEALLPKASGRPYEVLVVMDKEMWEAPAGRALFDILDTNVPGLPQDERSFHISQVEPKHLSDGMKIFRNLIMVNMDDRQFTQTRMRFVRDKYAMGQIVLTFNTPNEESLKEFCRAHRQEVVDFLTKTEMNRLIKELQVHYSKVIYDLAWNEFACKLYAPKEIKAYKKGTQFFWTSNNTAQGMVNICMYSYPYEGPETFCKEYVLQKRDSVMKLNMPGEYPGMYMQTDTAYTDVKAISVHGKYAMEIRGLWYMKEDKVEHLWDSMGGPFVSHSRLDTETNRVVVVEGFVYAPEKMKRGLMRRLEGALYTLQLPQEQYELIETEVEEEKPDSAQVGK
ncbi:MAG: DUF4837 family protein [Bacteroidaceae bacterium]